MSSTCVFLHAHPDDEALLTAGTMARLSAEGHRVVLVFATDGGAGLADPGASVAGDLGTVRRAEALASARVLGCARVEFLGYADSGLSGVAPGGFCGVPVESVAGRIAELLNAERARLVTIYDPAGGYGHPDHVHLHRVGALAARLAGTPILLEATVDRTLLYRAARTARACGLRSIDADVLTRSYVPPAEITHRVSVARYAAAKRASMAAHASQTGGGDSARTLAMLLRVPPPLFGWAFGTEWFVRRDMSSGDGVRTHPLS